MSRDILPLETASVSKPQVIKGVCLVHLQSCIIIVAHKLTIMNRNKAERGKDFSTEPKGNPYRNPSSQAIGACLDISPLIPEGDS